MESLIEITRLLQAQTFIYYTKAHGYHWNVEGILFDQFHDMFSDVYEDAWAAVDQYAEWVRIFDQYAVFDVMSILATSGIKYEDGVLNNPIDMLNSLSDSNDKLIADLKVAFDYANTAGEQGIADFFAGRITVHEKWRWKFNSSLKSIVNN
jgi:starvation-inducible DNA-binding protein